MTRDTQQSIARLLSVCAGVALFVTIGVMIADYAQACRRAPLDEKRVEELTRLAKEDDSQSAALEAEWERQTLDSLALAARSTAQTNVLIVAAVFFLIGTKWSITLGKRRVPSPKRIAAHRAPRSLGSSKRRRRRDQSACAHDSCEGCGTPSIDVSFVDKTIVKQGLGSEAVIPILQAIQSRYRYLPDEALRRVCELTEITPARITGVLSFYTQFRRSPVGRHLLRVCHGTACHVAGAPRITDEIRRELDMSDGADTDGTGEFTIEEVACMGCCTLAPVAQIDEVTYGHLSSDAVPDMLQAGREAAGDGAPRHRKALPAKADGDGTPLGEIRVGLGSCCVAGGSGKVYEALQRAIAATGARATIKRVGCVGMCHQTPLVETVVPGEPASLYAGVGSQDAKAIVRRHFRAHGVGKRITNTVSTAVERLLQNGKCRPIDTRGIELRDPPVAAFLGPQKHIATEHCGHIDPTDLDEYLRHDGFQAYRKCVENLSSDEVIKEISRSGLRGRGGAGFPTGQKWAKVREAVSIDKYIVCNGDEGDPGAFMDRMLMESFPYRLIEGIAIAAYAVHAREGYLYIRAEYPLAVQRLRDALSECEKRGYLGDNILGIGRQLKLHIMEGAGAFVCGEETALLASIEGRRGSPRLRPPYPAEQGLWGKPTLVNNVETFTTVPWIIRHGAEAFAALGTATSKGTKVFALAGKIKRGGLIEVPMGVTIREIVEGIGGGIKEDRQFKAVQIGGPSGGCVPAGLADTAVD